MPLMEKSGDFHLSVVAYGETCRIPTTKADFTRLGQDRLCVHAKNIICSGGWYARRISITFAEIILQTNHTLEIKEQLTLICTVAEYLHLDPSSLALIPVEDSLNKYFQNLTTLAEDIRYINSTKSRYVGLCWPVGFGVFAMLSELVRVLSHNAESNNLSQLLGYEIAGWRVLQQDYEKRNPNKWQNGKMATPKPTWRPTKAQNFTVLIAATPETHSVVKSEASSSLGNKATISVIHPYVEISTQPVIIDTDVEAIQTKSAASTIFHSLSFELSPSLMLSSAEFEDKVIFETPPISGHVLYDASTQELFPTTQQSEPKDNYYLGLFMPVTKNHFSHPVHHLMDISPEDLSSKGEIRSLNDHSPFTHRTASGFKSGEIISIIKLSLPSMSTLAYLRSSSSSSSSSSSVAVSLFLLHDSYQNQKLLNVYTSASETFMTLAPVKQMEVFKWIKSFILTNIPSIFDAIITNGDFYPEPGSPSNACPPTQSYCHNAPTSSKHSTDTLNNSTLLSSQTLLTFSILSNTISNPIVFPSFSLSVPVELALLFGLGNILPTEKLPDRRQVTSDRTKTHESFTTISLTYRFITTGNSVLEFMETEMDTSLWKKGTTLFYITTPSAVIFLSQTEMSHRKSQALELLSYRSSLTTHPLELVNTSSFYFSTDQCDSVNNLDLTSVLDPEALQLDINDLSLKSLFGTKINVQITGDIVSKLKESAIVFNNKGISTETGLHTTMNHKIEGQPNTPPRVINAIKWIAATVGHRFSFSIPPETFQDHEDGNSTQLTLGMNPIDGPPTDLESWLQFNARDQNMHGYPLDADFQYSPQQFSLFAIDSGGLKAKDKFIIELFRPTAVPCHSYTVVTTNSYHSFLKNRRRMNFFLKKLSKYLFAESPGDMVLLHLKTGSAVFTWYNKLLCAKTDKCARDEIQDVLTKLGRPGEHVGPDFAEAMLPEFKIERIGKVTYAGICLPTTKPTHDSAAFNRTATAFKGGNCLITNTFSALLIAICSTTLAILIVVHYQKYHKKTFQPQGPPSCGYNDFKMDLRSSRKSLVEREAPPSARLPLAVSMISQQPPFRPNQGLVISRLPSPPKYRLPPLYGRTDRDLV
ncbi:uncharacterized protein LOC120314413 isoform X2 [Crotalus tigris]|nr:uncharacterized protein LOC120314413 isoform X2 [Crotalus tigris]